MELIHLVIWVHAILDLASDSIKLQSPSLASN
jgi:hypothetical protein